jgi:hypothetical protein
MASAHITAACLLIIVESVRCCSWCCPVYLSSHAVWYVPAAVLACLIFLSYTQSRSVTVLLPKLVLDIDQGVAIDMYAASGMNADIRAQQLAAPAMGGWPVMCTVVAAARRNYTCNFPPYLYYSHSCLTVFLPCSCRHASVVQLKPELCAQSVRPEPSRLWVSYTPSPPK